MKKSKYIQEKLGPLLRPFGFVYSAPPNMWRYERAVTGPHKMKYRQSIYIKQGYSENTLFLYMDNSIPEQPTHMNTCNIIPGENRVQIPFDNDKDFKNIVDYFTQAIEMYLLPRLDNLSEIIVQDLPSFEDQRYVYDNHEELATNFCLAKGIDYHLALEQWQQLAYTNAMEFKGQTYTQAKQAIMEMASYFGVWLQTNRNGEWDFIEQTNTVVVKAQFKPGYGVTPVLHQVSTLQRKINERHTSKEIEALIYDIFIRYV